MLATQLNDKIANKDIEVKAIIRLDKYICNAVQSRWDLNFICLNLLLLSLL